MAEDDRTTSMAPDPDGEGPRAGLVARCGGAILFYTRLPLLPGWRPDFGGIAGLSPLVGLGLAGLLTGVDGLLGLAGMLPLSRSALIVALWLWLTGGLHLDGAMDTADGLAVRDGDRRLAVMADSRSGAFGVMAAISILGLKTLALADLSTGRGGLLATAMVWGRWGQVLAIARYPYLRPGGKGAFHKAHLRLPGDVLIGLAAGILLCGAWARLNPTDLGLAIGGLVGGAAAAWGIGAWLQAQLGGHTGDTYGATVEWTETLVICLGALLGGFQR